MFNAIFDDSFRHEVFAVPATEAVRAEEDARIVLIVDVWHPDLPRWQRPALLGNVQDKEQKVAIAVLLLQ